MPTRADKPRDSQPLNNLYERPSKHRTKRSSSFVTFLASTPSKRGPRFQELPDTFTTATALARGVHPRVLYALRDSGDVVELSRGVFRRADAPLASEPDLLAVAYRSPVAIVCCRSAAAVHELSDELPPRCRSPCPRGTAHRGSPIHRRRHLALLPILSKLNYHG